MISPHSSSLLAAVTVAALVWGEAGAADYEWAATDSDWHIPANWEPPNDGTLPVYDSANKHGANIGNGGVCWVRDGSSSSPRGVWTLNLGTVASPHGTLHMMNGYLQVYNFFVRDSFILSGGQSQNTGAFLVQGGGTATIEGGSLLGQAAETGGVVQLVDASDNQGDDAGGEALYARRLEILPDWELDLNGRTLYYVAGESPEALTADGRALLNGGQLIQLNMARPGTIMLVR